MYCNRWDSPAVKNCLISHVTFTYMDEYLCAIEMLHIIVQMWMAEYLEASLIGISWAWWLHEIVSSTIYTAISGIPECR